MQLTANVYVNTGFRGANVGYVTTSDGIVMIDSPQMPSDAIAWRREIAGRGQLKYLVNTEGHGDHTFGNYFFAASVIAHEKAAETIRATDVARFRERVREIDPNGLPLLDEYQVNAPAITFSHRLTLHLGSHHFYLHHLPGHTAGQAAVFIPEEKVVFTGDNVCYQVLAFLHEADPFAWLDSLQRLGELEVDHIVPGHGEVCDPSYLDEQAGFIRDWVDTVKQAIGRGWSQEEAQSRISMLDRYPPPGPPGDFWKELEQTTIAHLYHLLSS